jgi:hypothetical protein
MSGEPPRRSTRGKRGTEPAPEPEAAPAPVEEPPKRKTTGRTKKPIVIPKDEEAPAAAPSVPLAEIPPEPTGPVMALPAPAPAEAPVEAAAAAPADGPLGDLAALMAEKIPASDEGARLAAEAAAAAPAPASPGPASMDASQASAVLSQTSMASAEIDETAMTMSYYQVTSQQFPEALGERFNVLLPSMGETPIPFSALKADGDRGARIVAFTVARVPPGSVLGKDYTLVTGDLDKVAAVGLFVIYPGQTGTPNLKVLAYGTRLDLRPAEGADPYLTFALRDIAEEAQRQFGPTALIRYARKQARSPEYTTTLGTLSGMGFAFSSFNADGAQVLLKISDTLSVDVSQVRMDAGAGGVVYEYLEEDDEATRGSTKTVTFPEIQEVQILGRRGAGISTSVEMIARVGTIMTPADGIITIPDAELRDATPTKPRRGGRKTFRAKKGRKTTYRRSF